MIPLERALQVDLRLSWRQRLAVLAGAQVQLLVRSVPLGRQPPGVVVDSVRVHWQNGQPPKASHG